jgi:hypothetical protein
VCAADVRGSGDLTPALPRGYAGYARGRSQENAWALASLQVGRPLLGQRALDIISVARALRQRIGASKPLWLMARADMTIPAALAAVLEPQITGLYLQGGWWRLADLLEPERAQFPLAQCVPGQLQTGDLPQWLAAMAPRRVVVASPVRPGGQPVPLEELDGFRKAAGNEHIRFEAWEWSLEALLQATA